MVTGKDKPDEGAAGPETSLTPINKGPAWVFLDSQGLNTPRDSPVDEHQRLQSKPAVAKLLNEPDSAERVASASVAAALHEDENPELVEPVRLILEAEEHRQQAFMRTLLGDLPAWVHSETWRQLSIAYCDLAGHGFADEQILGFVARHEEGFVPGRAPDSISFLHAVNYLAHVRYAVSLGPPQGLEVLYGPDASRGYRVRQPTLGPRGSRWHVAALRECLAALMTSVGRKIKRRPTLKELVKAAERNRPFRTVLPRGLTAA